MLNLIAQFQEDAKKLGRNTSSVQEFKLWLQAGGQKLNSTNGSGYAKIIESEQPVGDGQNEEVIKVEIIFQGTYRKGMSPENYVEIIQQTLDDMEVSFEQLEHSMES